MSKRGISRSETRRECVPERGNKTTYSPLEKAWGVRMVRPLAMETTRLDSICVGCMLVVVEEEDRNNVGFRLFRGGVFACRPVMVPPDIKVSLLGSRSLHSRPSPPLPRPTHLLPFSSRRPMKMGGQFALLDFPVEIICHILSFVSYRDLIRSTLVRHPGV